ncbi:MAG: hydroxymethylglutaryl-CoA reductase, degradative [Ardenticatenaceae bacterium]|nr:hydroxymethylglutaryl-CoA reductase, degradative [Ardenticatenaceae bacterium]MCB9443609.1 hydroxymethylglutaryl-CoA reductase, degradative [Ardenticatenaceae bacterium]
MSERSSRLPGFYKLSLAERVETIAEWANLTGDEKAILVDRGLKADQADMMIENALGTFELPLGIAANFQINGRDYLIPMAVEEPSVLAAISHAAKLIRAGGGFHTEATEPVMIGQIQVLDVPDMDAAVSAIETHKADLMAIADTSDPIILKFGGGARDIIPRVFPDTPVGPMLIVHLHFDTRDAMGANAINTALERLAPRIAELTNGRTSLRILSNLADQRLATARCTIPADQLAVPGMSGTEAARRIEEANAFAIVDPYRAATHNKGIMNGIDAVVIATGNDWRAIEAGAHTYASRNGRYTSLTDWHVDENGDLYGAITLPMAVGMVGGATKVHPTARVAMKILGVKSAPELAQVMAAVGLAQNLAAIKALSTVGIQKGHMALHARQVAMAAGASSDQIQQIADQLVAEKNINVNRAKELLGS